MPKKTILLTAVGRRNYIVHYFKSIPGYDCRVIACNSIENTVGMWAADKAYVAPSIMSNEYIPFLLDICKKEKVDCLFSLFDSDVLYLSKHKYKFEEINVLPIISDTEVVTTCLDKIKSNNFLNNIGINTPRTYTSIDYVVEKLDKKEIKLPLILKPQLGQGSIATEKVYEKDELFHAYHYLNKKVERSNIIDNDLQIKNTILIQEFIEGDEYGLDCINDLKGKNVSVIIKKKFSMRAGETDSSVTVYDDQIKDAAAKISNNLKHIGLLDVDLIRRNNDIYVLDMNPRFGGGYPFSHAAGANIAKALLSWIDNLPVDKKDLEYEEGIISLKGIELLSKKIK